MGEPTELHLQAAKRIMRYLGTINYGIFYKKGGKEKLLAFTNSDYVGDVQDRKSTSGCVLTEFWCSVIVIKETACGYAFHHRVRGSYILCLSSNFEEKGIEEVRLFPGRKHSYNV